MIIKFEPFFNDNNLFFIKVKYGYRAKKELNLKEKDFAGLLQNHL